MFHNVFKEKMFTIEDGRKVPWKPSLFEKLSKNEKHTVKPKMGHTSKEIIKCRLDNFLMGFTLFYVNLSICENK